MSRAPRTSGQASIDEYTASWRATMKMLREGKSFSGHERNCAFLNTGASLTADAPAFANISAISGFDFDDDGRALATVDWDHDGDLDVWVQNRTGPRLRFLRNQTRTGESSQRNFVSIRLQGVHCNRDAIGARVEVVLKQKDAPKLTQTLYAGDGYLSQSSKWLHFGLSTGQQIDYVAVGWPDGSQQQFDSIQAGHRYLLEQDAAVARPADLARSNLAIQHQAQRKNAPTGSRRAMLASPVPMPPLHYQPSPQSSNTALIPIGQQPTLMVLWSSWCPNCQRELAELAAERAAIEAAGLHVVALNVDHLAVDRSATADAAEQTLKQLEFPFSSGHATDTLIDKLQIMQRVVLNREYAFAVPTSLLVDRRGNLTALYQGNIQLETVLDDLQHSTSSIVERRDYALPFEGTWTTPPSVLLLRPVATVFRQAGYEREYEYFLQVERGQLTALRDAARSEDERRQVDLRFANASFDIALSLLEAGRVAESIDYFRQGLEIVPDSAPAHYHYGRALIQLDQSNDAVEQLRRAVELDPDYVAAHFDLGVQKVNTNELDAAARHFESVVRLQPRHVDAWSNLGVTRARLQQPGPAVEALREALKLRPDHVPSNLALGGLLASAGEFRRAATFFLRATQTVPESPQAWAGLGQVLAEVGEDADASQALRQAIQLEPRDAGSRLKLAWLQATSPEAQVQDPPAALRVARTLAKQTRFRDPRVLDVLAAALAATEEFRRAVEVADEALNMIPQAHPLHAEIKGRRALYATGRAYRARGSAD